MNKSGKNTQQTNIFRKRYMRSDHACAVQTHFFHCDLESEVLPGSLQETLLHPPKIITKVTPNASKKRSKNGLRKTTPEKHVFYVLLWILVSNCSQMAPQWAPMGSKMPPKIIKIDPWTPRWPLVPPGVPKSTNFIDFDLLLGGFWGPFCH